MFRPPAWDLVQDATAALPNAITALGTSDETTLVVIGRDNVQADGRDGATHDVAMRTPAKDVNPLNAHAATTEKLLRGIYQNYRIQSTSATTVDGHPALEQRARGIADGHDWSVISLTFGHGTDVYTILGMTYADSDLIQIRENVIAKMVGSLHFLPPAAR